MAVSFIGRRNQIIQRKPQTYRIAPLQKGWLYKRGSTIVLNWTYFQSYTESNVNDLTASGGEPLGFLTSIRPWSTVISTILQYIRVHLKLKNACLISWSPLNSYICTQVIIVVSQYGVYKNNPLWSLCCDIILLPVLVMVFNGTFNNISAISWLSVLLVEETGVPRENHRPAASHWQTLSHNVVHLALIEIRAHNISDDRH